MTVSYELFRSRVDPFADLAGEGKDVSPVSSITQIEGMEIGIGTRHELVLQHGFQLVERFGELRFRCYGIGVFVPKRHEIIGHVIRQVGTQRLKVPSFALLPVVTVRLVRGRNITRDCFAKIMKNTQLEQLFDIDTKDVFLKEQNHQTQPPAVLRSTLRSSAPAGAGAQSVLELFGCLKKGKKTGQPAMVNNGGVVAVGFAVHGRKFTPANTA